MMNLPANTYDPGVNYRWETFRGGARDVPHWSGVCATRGADVLALMDDANHQAHSNRVNYFEMRYLQLLASVGLRCILRHGPGCMGYAPDVLHWTRISMIYGADVISLTKPGDTRANETRLLAFEMQYHRLLTSVGLLCQMR